VLSVIATPIGNMKDITLRAIETLQACDAVVCEDTRVAGQLLKMLDIPKKHLISLHGYSDPRKLGDVIQKLAHGSHLALVSDAGTPGISDPGYALVSRARAEGLPIESVPGPSAVVAALSISGLPIHHFRYLGFLPLKKGRQTLLKTFVESEESIVFYESVHRIERTLRELGELFAEQPNRQIVVARELTKMYEEVIATTVAGLPELAEKITQKGEFVIIIGPK
jgi:16S rRNA (cytidine1402-2'-O)-methyltransferase